jgi:DHA2 family multidrug resistance protein-like MFS transporter
MPDTTSQTKAGRRAWIGLLVLALPGLLVTMDLTVLFLAVPGLTADLAASSTELLWITDVYGFLIAGALIVSGALGDRLGRRRIMLVGAAGFAAASVLASAASGPEMLIVARALQGIAGAALLPSMMALVFGMFPDPQQRTAALGVMMGTFALGAALGPLLGGGLLELFDWRAVFIPNVPVMVGLILLAPRYVPEARNPAAGRVDVLSAALSVAGVLGVVYGIKDGARNGFGATDGAVIAGGLALLALFTRRQLALANPLVDVRLFTRPAFRTAIAATTAGMFVIYGAMFFTAQHLQLVAGLSPLEAGLWGLPPVAAMMVVSGGVVPRLATWVRPAHLVSGGMFVACCGLLILTQLEPGSSVAPLVVALTLLTAGLAPTTTMGVNLIVGAAPPEQAGTVSGLGQAGNELGGALGIALLGSVGTAIYRGDMEGVARGAAGDTLSGAVSLTGRLPSGVLDAATEAFAHGMHVAASIAIVLLGATAALVAVVLRALPAEGAPSTDATGLDLAPARA